MDLSLKQRDICANNTCDECGYGLCDIDCSDAAIADYLIANGVIALPCKIGDDIWWIDSENNSVECEKNGVTGFIIKKNEILIRDRTGGEDKIGTQYCYLSKDDAEKALEGE